MPDRGHELVDLFVRDLDQIDLPPRDRWRPTPRKESYVMRSSRYVLYAGAVAAVLVAALIVGFGLRDRNVEVATSPSPIQATATPFPTSGTPLSSPPPATPTATASLSPAPTAQTGAISGRISYPSDFIPPVTLYAINTTDQRVWFSVEFPGYGNAPRTTAQPGTEPGTYTLTGVAPGTYWVVAYRNDGQKPDPGFYSRVSECLRRTPSGPCPDQNFAMVTVTAGQTTREIDIVLWWPASGLVPPPPPRPTATSIGGATPIFAATECTTATATTRQVIERYFALSTSTNAQAVTDCFAKVWRDKNGAAFTESAAQWSRSGPPTGLVITFVDALNGCDRFSVNAQMTNSAVTVPPFFSVGRDFSVGPEAGRVRIYETSTALTDVSPTTLRCG